MISHISCGEGFSRTEAVLCQRTFNWKIENSFGLDVKREMPLTLESPKFRMGPRKEYEWCMKLKYDRNLSVVINRSESIQYAETKCTVFDGVGEIIESRDIVFRGKLPEMKVEFDVCRSISTNGIELVFEANVVHDKKNTSIHCEERTFTLKPVEFPSYFCSLLHSDKFTDLNVRVGSTIIRAHRVVLAANSPFFAGLLEKGETEEAITGIVDASDFDEDTVRMFLGYLYTHSTPNLSTWRSACRLFVMADRYSVADLKEICKKFLLDLLTKSDAVKDKTPVSTTEEADPRIDIMAYIHSHPNISKQTIPLSPFFKIMHNTWDLLKVAVDKMGILHVPKPL